MSSILKKLAKKKFIEKKPKLKTNKASLKIESRETESILNDPNRFFKDEYEEAKETLFWK